MRSKSVFDVLIVQIVELQIFVVLGVGQETHQKICFFRLAWQRGEISELGKKFQNNFFVLFAIFFGIVILN